MDIDDAPVSTQVKDAGDRVPNQIKVNGYGYRANKRRQTKVYFICFASGCKGKYTFDITKQEGIETGKHSCNQDALRGQPKIHGSILHIEDEMKVYIKTTAYQFAGQEPYKAACKIFEHFKDKYPDRAYEGFKVEQIQTLLIRTRNGEATGDAKVSSAPFCMVSPIDPREFLQFDIKINLTGTSGYNRMIGWAHPALIKLFANGARALFIDGTFYCVPRPFTQLIIIMQYSKAHDLYIPTWYILLDGKSELLYRQMFFSVKMVHERYGSPFAATTATCDFEAGLQNAIKEALAKEDLEGCLFHFKQAVRTHSVKVIKFVAATVSEIMVQIDVLTIIAPEEIWRKGIPYVLSKFDLAADAEKWALFTAYMGKTWLTYYNAVDWNVHRFVDQERSTDFDCKITNRTNNPAENYNGVLGRCFSAGNGHPNVETFVNVIKEKSKEYVDRIARIENETESKQGHPLPKFPSLPADYLDFIPPSTLLIGTRLFDFEKDPSAKSQRARVSRPAPAPVVEQPPAEAPEVVVEAVAAPAVVVEPVVLPVLDVEPLQPDEAPVDQPAVAPATDAGMQDLQVAIAPVPRYIKWIQCDACEKWRTIPTSVDITLFDQQMWICRNNTWNEELANCDAAEEESDDIVVV